MRTALTHAAGAAPVRVAAVGKAAITMTLGAFDALGAAIEQALVITRDADTSGQLQRHAGVELLQGSHPVPDERSLAAGARLLRWVDELPAGVQPLFLISGGSSALAEVPEAGAGLADLASLTRQSFEQGMPIGELNARRAALSRIKGGKLATRLHGRPARALFVSDVPDDDPRVIGSGLMGPAPSGVDRVQREVVASVEHAVAAVAEHGRALGLTVRPPGRRFDDDALRLAARFAHELELSAAQLCVWGGESTVRLPAQPGVGGRNQHLALAAARLIAGEEDLLFLAAGTDGTDGPTDDAGALVDGETCARVTVAGLDVERSLLAADSQSALAAAGDLVHTGPTGTNVGDLAVGLKLSTAQARSWYERHPGANSPVR